MELINENSVYEYTAPNGTLWFCYDIGEDRRGYQKREYTINEIRRHNNNILREHENLLNIAKIENEKRQYEDEVLSFFKPINKLTAGRILKILEQKTYLNGDHSKIYTRFELLKLGRRTKERMLKKGGMNHE